MKKKILRFIIIILTCIFLIPQASYSIYTGGAKPTEPEFAPTRLIVKLKPGVDKKITLGKAQGKIITTGLAQLDRLNLKFKVKKQEKLFKEFKQTALKLDQLSSVYILEVPAGTDLSRMKKEYESRAEVEYAELDYRLELFEELNDSLIPYHRLKLAGVPNDPLFPHQWYLNNTGQGYLGINRIPGDHNDTQVIKYGTVDADLDALATFVRNEETTIPVVGIIDTGVDLDHPDLADNIWTNPGEIPNNGTDDDHNGFVDDFYGWDFSDHLEGNEIIGDHDPTDYDGHGTHCAGIAGSVRDNRIGVSGINTPCRIMAIKIFPYAFFSVCAEGIIYAADMGCDVINMSWGSAFPSKLIEDALDYAVERGVLPIAASGNSGGEDDFYPASLPQVFTVGASNSDDEVTYFSTYGDHIEVVAPGEDILSLRADNSDMYAEGGASGKEPYVHIVNEHYYLADGTSMASPCVVGVAAYILSASPGMSRERVKEIMQESADDIVYPYGGDSLYSPGRDIYSGYGRVNLNSALQLISGGLAKIDYPDENALVSGNVVIWGTASGDSFQNYVLEYGEGFFPVNWTVITNSNFTASNDTLGIWNSTGLTGRFTLRLTVGSKNQAVAHVIADNSSYVKITSLSDGDTVKGNVEVYGHTVVPDFSRYTLLYGFGESPTYWDTIITSTRMVADGILANWLVSFLEENSYTLRLMAETNSGENYADTVVVIVTSIASVGWFKELSGYGSLSPAVGDIDGDGYDEIVAGVGGPAGSGMSGGVEVFSHQGQSEVGWPKDTDKNMMSSPVLGDLDEDGVNDIVICSEQGVHAYLSHADDWYNSVWTGGNSQWSLATPVIADLENDGHLEVLTMNNLGTIYAWRNDGQSKIPSPDGFFAQASTSVGSMGFPCLAVADLDKDGNKEVIAGTAYATYNEFGYYGGEGGIYIWDINGIPLLGPQDYPNKLACIYGIAVANVDTCADLEVIILGQNENHLTLSAFKKDGSRPSGYPIILEDLKADWWFGNHPAIGDLDKDGTLEIVVSVWSFAEARIYAWHQDGMPLGTTGSKGLIVSMRSSNSEKKKEVLSSLGRNIAEITDKIKNMSKSAKGRSSDKGGVDAGDASGAPGVNHTIHASGGEELASLICTFSEDSVFASVNETFGSPVLADVNGDGNVDIIARAGYLLGTGYERVFAWDYEGNLVPGFPLFVSSVQSPATFYPYTPVLADVDKDGKLDMVLATDFPDPKLLSWEFDINYDTTDIPWPKYMHDNWNSGIFRKNYKTSVGDEDQPLLQTSFTVSQNHPNPFNSETVIEYLLPKESRVKITVYNLLGQMVKTLLDQKESAGHKRVIWDGKNEKGEAVSSGIYFYRIEAKEFVQTEKMVLLK